MICVLGNRWMAPQRYVPLSFCRAARMLIVKSRPLGNCVMRKRRSRSGWLLSSGKAASFSIWFLRLMRYQLSTKLLDVLEKLQVKVAVSPSATVRWDGLKVRGPQDLLGVPGGGQRTSRP